MTSKSCCCFIDHIRIPVYSIHRCVQKKKSKILRSVTETSSCSQSARVSRLSTEPVEQVNSKKTEITASGRKSLLPFGTGHPKRMSLSHTILGVCEGQERPLRATWTVGNPKSVMTDRHGTSVPEAQLHRSGTYQVQRKTTNTNVPRDGVSTLITPRAADEYRTRDVRARRDLRNLRFCDL